MIQIHARKNCDLAGAYKQDLCPSPYEYFDGKCYKASTESKKFSDAEVACLADPVSPGARSYHSRMAWTDKRQHLEFMARLVQARHGADAAEHWVGLDNRDLAPDAPTAAQWEDSNGDVSVPGGGPLWAPGAPRIDQYCAKAVRLDGGSRALDSDQCVAHLPYVCERPPLTAAPVDDCPVGYVARRGACYMAVAEEKSYDDAQEHCSRSGGVMDVAKRRSHYEFLRALAAKKSEFRIKRRGKFGKQFDFFVF